MTTAANAIMSGPLAGLPNDPTEVQIGKFFSKKIKAGVDLVDKEKIIAALAATKVLGRRALEKLWKGTERTLSKSSDIGLCYVDIKDDFHKRNAYAQRRITASNEKDPFLFQRGGMHVSVGRDEKGRAFIEELAFKPYKQRLNLISLWQKTTDDGIETQMSIPDDTAEFLYYGAKDYLPPLDRLATYPTFTAKRRLTPPGYKDGVFFDPPPGFTIADVPEKPDAAATLECVLEVIDLFGDFSLGGMSREDLSEAIKIGRPVPDLAHLFSYMITGLTRDMIDGPSPLHMARKSVPRSGGTLLMTTAESVVTCQPSEPQTLSSNDEEIRKMVLSLFLSGAPYGLLDNIRGGKEFDSDVLASVITAYPVYRDRLLGLNKMAVVPAKIVWGGTGNRSSLSPQMAERTLMISVDPRLEKPGERPPSAFKYDLAKRLREKGTHYLWCLLVIIQNWIAKGCPEWQGTSLGGFQRHAAVVGGILEAAGINGFMGNRKQLAELVATDDPASEFMDALIDVHRGNPNTVFKASGISEGTQRDVALFRQILEDAQIAMPSFGYKTNADGEITYPTAADRTIAQRVRQYVGTVREDEGVRYTFVRVDGTPRNQAAQYRLQEDKVASPPRQAVTEPVSSPSQTRKRRRSRVKF